MRKIALLLAGALIVSAPLVATTTTDTYAAAKAKKSAKKAEPKADPNTAFIRAINDLAKSLDPATAKSAKGKKAGKKKA